MPEALERWELILWAITGWWCCIHRFMALLLCCVFECVGVWGWMAFDCQWDGGMLIPVCDDKGWLISDGQQCAGDEDG